MTRINKFENDFDILVQFERLQAECRSVWFYANKNNLKV